MCFFFFKQKTAYEMRISDWSSDVCSSDLIADQHRTIIDLQWLRPFALGIERRLDIEQRCAVASALLPGIEAVALREWILHVERGSLHARGDTRLGVRERPAAMQRGVQVRSEEHTSELQSLMRISYAVFCLKKK